MIKGNVIYFGLGSILTNNKNGKLILKEIKSPQKIGTKINWELEESNDLEILQQVILEVKPFDLDKINLIKNKLKDSIKIDNYVLNFSNYNKKSIEVVYKHMITALNYNNKVRYLNV